MALMLLLILPGKAQWTTSGTNIYNTNAGNVGIGTTAPVGKLEVHGPGSSSAQTLVTRNNSSNGFYVYSADNLDYIHSLVALYRSRGTYQSPADVLAGDRIGSLGAAPYISGAYRGSVGLDFYVGASPGASSYPAYMIFGTTPTNGTTRLERMRIAESGNVGIGTTSPSYLLHVNGTVAATGYQTISDQRFKSNIKKLEGSLDKLSSLQGYSYSFNAEKFKDRNFPTGEHMGVLAQQIQKVFPASVMQDADGYLSVDYISLIPVMLEAIKELKAQLDQTRGNNLVDVLSPNPGDLALYRGAYLNQNAPNPFNGQTSVEYAIPENAQVASIVIHDLSGRQIKKIELVKKGSGVIDIGAETTAPGLYLYSLVLDGKPVVTRKMLVEK